MFHFLDNPHGKYYNLFGTNSPSALEFLFKTNAPFFIILVVIKLLKLALIVVGACNCFGLFKL